MCLQLPKSILFQSGGGHVETGEWLNLQAAGESLQLPGGAGGEGLPHFGPVSEMQRAGFPLKSKFAPPLAFSLPHDQSESLSSLHTRTSKPIWFTVPRRKQVENSHLQPEKAWSNLAKVKQGQGQMEVRSLSSGQVYSRGEGNVGAIWLPWTSQVYIGAETNKGSQTAAQVLSHQLWLLLEECLSNPAQPQTSCGT